MVDSEYDMKCVRFRTGRPTRQEQAILSVLHSEQHPEAEFRTLDFDVGLSIAGSWQTLLAWGIVVGLLLAGQSIVGQVADLKLSATTLVLIQIALGLAAGIFAAFKLGKGI